MEYYKDNFCTLINAECLKTMEEMAKNNMKFDAIITDIPYGTTACKWDAIIPPDKMWSALDKITKDNGAIVLFTGQPFTSFLIVSNPKLFKYEIIWEKERPTNIFNMKKQVGKVHENILLFYKNQCTYNPIMEERIGNYISPDYDLTLCNNNGTETYNNTTYKYSKDYDSSKKYPRSVMKFTRDRDRFHPTQKPLKLLEYLINTYTNEGDSILDFTCGSGTTLVAAKKLKRHCYGIDNEEKYCKVAKERLEGVE